MHYLSLRLRKVEKTKKYYEEYSKFFKKGHFLNEAINIDIHNYLSNNNLTKVDRACLANSLESRPPILDHELIEYACKIHPDLKLKGSEGKYIFKKALEGILPKTILYRKKQGFGVPLKHYFKNELREFVDKYVLNYDGHDFFGKEYLNTIRENLEKKNWEKDYSRAIWTIMMFNMWYDEWIR